jgi:hypothetical protein
MYYYNNEIKKKYPRKDIKEKIEGLKGTYYKLIDQIPEFNEITQSIVKDKIVKTKKKYQNISHLKIAYQTYKVIDKPESQVISKFEQKFGQWLDEIYPIWKRQKHALESALSNGQRKKNADDWRNWEMSQRELLEQKIIDKDYTFSFKILDDIKQEK